MGKTTYAQALSNKTFSPVYRAFRTDIGAHWGERGELEGKLKSFGVPVNTHVEDFFAADFIAQTRTGLILDRSLPSAIAYATVRGEALPNPTAMLDFWQQALMDSGKRVVYVWLRGPYELAKKRCATRKLPVNKAEFNKLDKCFEKLFQRIKLEKMQIDVSVVNSMIGVERILAAV